MPKSEAAPTQNDIIIVVLGPTGSGKSTFIQHAVKEGQGSAIGHNLRSCTQDIRLVKSKLSINGRPIVFVDTPGLGDEYKSDIEILTLISDRLLRAYKSKVKLDSILYLYRISDNRMAGPLLRNFELLASACGKTTIPNVTFITTMWTHVPEATGKRREEELKSSFWSEMIQRDCPVERFRDTGDSALDIVALSLKADRNQLSHEASNTSKAVKRTVTEVALNKQLEKLLNDQKEGEKRLSALLKNSGENQQAIEGLERSNADIKKGIAQLAEEMLNLKVKISLPRRLWHYFQRMFPGYQKP